MIQFAFGLFNGLSWAMAVFLVAAGLTLVFGILKILNFSHGGFFMIGAYLAYSLFGLLEQVSIVAFLLIGLVCGAAVGLAGWGIERIVFRRLAHVHHAYTLIGTYALLLLCEGFVKMVWGVDFLSISWPDALSGALIVGSVFMPYSSLFVIGAGVIVFLALDHVIHRTPVGKLTQSVSLDPWMASLLGVNVPFVFMVVTVAGFALAGLAGGLLAPNQSLDPSLASVFIIQAFGAIIVGGIGNIRGAFVAAILLGLVDSFGTVYMPEYPGIFFYVAMVLILLFRPTGLLGGEQL